MPLSLTLVTTFTFVLAVSGCISGFLAGLLGVGGGIIIVPVLYHVLAAFDVDMALRAHIAVGTSLATIIPTSLQSIRTHRAKGAVDATLLRFWAPFVGLGVLVGVLIARFAPGTLLTAVFGMVAAIVAAYMLFTREGWHPFAALPAKPVQAGMAGGIGTLSTLMGIGGGTLTVPVLSVFSYPVRRAVGTASVVGLIIALPGTLGYIFNGFGREGLPPLSLGYVNLAALLAIVVTSMWFAPMGARAAHTIAPSHLRKAFGIFLASTSIKMLADVLP
ncbi:sulfite exporter TauE/SafE family protein [Paracoccus sp. WLY502]|uniref:sulfite exporter TauE/SafE family protein n=1 Tax=Paracoccus yibinensis TaxID=3068891 RepID=UPI0027964D4C|nr:sulfite exporter TauE/SafE family protein [Paracoccus sp. WLY502]MDQ1902409.1 sulfite exporter TauE/SafE family protein [Paracoccus sp. WLY502]